MDTGLHELHKIAKLYDLPDYVKEASAEETMFGDDLPPAAYADPANKRFRCHNKAATMLNYLYFIEQRIDMPTKTANWIQQRFEGAGRYFGILGDMNDAAIRYSSRVKTAEDELSDSSFAIVWVGDDHRKYRRYRMTNTLEVKKAADWLISNRASFVFEHRHKIASKILEKMAEYGAGLSDDTLEVLDRMAGHGMYDPKEAAAAIRQRLLLTSKVAEDTRQGMLKLADTIESQASLALDASTVKAAAETVDQFDQTYKIAGRYSDTVPMPEDIFCKITFRAAKQLSKDACQLVTGTIYNRDQLAKLALSDVQDLLGDAAKEVIDGLVVCGDKMAEVAATLPRPEARKLEMLLEEAGQQPIFKTADARQLTDEARRELSLVYHCLANMPKGHS